MAYAKITYALEDGVAMLAMNDPPTLNAVDPDMVGELAEGFAAAAREARAAILTGAGRAFSSGANLSLGAHVADEGAGMDVGKRLESHYNPFVTLLRDLPIPFVTAVNGAAAGIGCSFALMGDLIVAGESGYFLQAFRRIGLVPDGGATYFLPRMLGRARAMELMLLGEKLPAAKALEWGLINRCVPDGELMSTARALALELASGPKSLGLIRKLAWEGLDAHWHAQLQAERQTQRQAGQTQDFIEGVTAFMQKRPADFKGA
jgi:2-(1,2-epoxy-1,2-dihydrophenyl)acetyl-CoA isomerase